VLKRIFKERTAGARPFTIAVIYTNVQYQSSPFFGPGRKELQTFGGVEIGGICRRFRAGQMATRAEKR